MSWLLLALLAAFFLGPIGILFTHLNTGVIAETFAQASLLKTLSTTLISSLGGAAISLTLGVILGRQFALHHWKGKRLQRLLALIPYLVPNFILATAYVVSWNPGTGLLNSVLNFPFGLYGLWGMTFLFGVVHAPIALLLSEDKFGRIDSSLREAARLSGASTRQIFFQIEFPLLIPTLVSAFALCFALNLSAFAIPAWIGAPERAYPLTFKIYQAIQLGGADGIPKAAVLSLILFGLSIFPLALTSASQRGERKLSMVSGKASRKSELKSSPLGALSFQAFFWITQIAFWIAPLGTLFVSTLVKPGCLQTSGLSCLRETSLRSYRYVLFDLAETQLALKGSFLYGTLSALLVMAIAVSALMTFSRRGKQLLVLEWIFALPVATPGAIIALALIVSYSGRYGINLYNTAWIVVVAFVIKHANLAFQPLRTGLANLSPSLFEAARLAGANTFQIWTRIVLPILRPEFLGGIFLVLIPILGELTMSVFLASPAYRSIGTLLFDLQDYADQASAAALSVALVLIILTVNELARLLSKGKLGY